jgi:ABC-type sugar transport system substrate-binding protein
MTPKVSVFIGSSSNGKSVVERLKGWFTEKAGELAVAAWSEGTFGPNESYLESLINALARHDFAILVATADDLAQVRGKDIIQARDNVIFEYGLFMGKLGRARTFLAYADSLKRPTDLDGISGFEFNEHDVAGGDVAAIDRLGTKLLDAIERCNDRDGGFFVLFPSLRDDPFYLDLLSGIACPSAGTRDVTFLVPREAYSGQQFLDRLDELASKQRGFKGGLIAPTLSGINLDELRARIARFRIPIVLVDINPFEGTTMPEKTFYVGVDNFEGGSLAARYVRAGLAGVKAPRVLVLENPDQAKRADGFLAGLGPGCEIVRAQSAFSAEAGRDATIKALRHRAPSSRPFQAIFAVSDEIALGAIDALSVAGGATGDGKMIVVGFDGTSAAKKLIDLKISPLRNTVEQDAYQMGERAMSLLRQVVDGSLPPGTRPEQFVPVRLYIEPESGTDAAPGRPLENPAPPRTGRKQGARRKSGEQ